jgi:hypothetical protein
MTFLRRKHEEPPPPIAEDAWRLAEGEHEGRPMILRFNDGAGSARTRFGLRLGVAVPLVNADTNGFPGDRDSEDLNAIEDALFASLKADGVGAVVVSTGGMREFVLYVRDKNVANRAVAAAREAAGAHKIQHYVKSDPSWVAYEELRP